ncbi:MAG TPA: hypothetical protein VLC09_21215 [Polyangiaceae bacterium]|nr:hypothetical protein [Polyangiaceae bacterium]
MAALTSALDDRHSFAVGTESPEIISIAHHFAMRPRADVRVIPCSDVEMPWSNEFEFSPLVAGATCYRLDGCSLSDYSWTVHYQRSPEGRVTYIAALFDSGFTGAPELAWYGSEGVWKFGEIVLGNDEVLLHRIVVTANQRGDFRRIRYDSRVEGWLRSASDPEAFLASFARCVEHGVHSDVAH